MLNYKYSEENNIVFDYFYFVASNEMFYKIVPANFLEENCIKIIKKYDINSYDVVLKYCKNVAFWNGNYSTVEDSQTIVITRKDITNSCLNNISAILVHESTHLKIMNQKIKYTPYDEELFCYYTELEFLRRIPNVEIWLINHTKIMINYYGE